MFNLDPSGSFNFNRNLYYYCGFIRKLCPQVMIDYDSNNIYYLTRERHDKEMRAYLNVDRKTYREIKDIHREVRFFEGFVVLMPFEVWDKLFDVIKNKTTKEKKTLARLYIYLYYWSMRNLGSYSHARTQIMFEIYMSKDDISEGTDFLESCGLIHKGDYSVLDSYRKARTYFIPEEDWSDRCRQEVEKASMRTKNK